MEPRPTSSPPDRVDAFFRRLPVVASAIAIAVAGLVLVGWLRDLAVLKSVVPGFIAMNPMTATSFILAGLSLLLQSRGQPAARMVGKVLASTVVLIGLSKLSDLFLHSSFGWDRLLFKHQVDIAVPINRMAPSTALSFVLLGAALVALQSHEGRQQRTPRLLVLPVLFLSLMAVLGYAYGIRSFYHFAALTPMALHTGLVFWFLGSGVLFTDAERGMTRVFTGHDAGGVMLRGLAPFALIVIPALGWFRLQGERAGWYDMPFGVSLTVLSNVVLLMVILWSTAGTLRRTDLERQKANRALQQARDDLEQRVHERTAELERANQTLTSETLERQQAEEALRLSRERFRAFMENSPAAAFIKDRKGRMLYLNRYFEQRFQTTATAVEGRTEAELWPEDLARQFRESDRVVLESGKPVELSVTVPMPGGEPRQWLIFKFPIEDVSGQRLVGGMGIDVSDRAAAEAALRKTEDQLRQAQKMEAVGRLAGGVAHDFNNMLTAIMGFSQLIRLRLGPDSAVRRDAEEIERAAQRAATLTRQLLAFSRQQVLRPQVLDLGAVVAELEPMLRRLIGEDVKIVTETPPDLGRVKADPGQIEQIVMNLAVNARDAMTEGGTLVIETANTELVGEGSRGKLGMAPGPYVMLAVSDTGCGMDAATRERIFEPFFTTKELGKGTGLGLSTVYGIVKQSDGHIDVYSEPGRGTSFKIYLPRVDEALAIVDTSRQPAAPQGGAEVILLVEDEPQVRTVLREALQLNGYQVLEAADGLEGLALCERADVAIDLLVTDVTMPHLGGAELGKRSAQLRPGLKILYISGYTDKAVMHGGFLQAGTHYLAKPFTPEVFLRKVREVLDQPFAQAA